MHAGPSAEAQCGQRAQNGCSQQGRRRERRSQQYVEDDQDQGQDRRNQRQPVASGGVTETTAPTASSISAGSLRLQGAGTFTLTAPNAVGTLAGSTTGALIATVSLPITGGWQTWKTVSAPATSTSGIHYVYMVFKGGDRIANVNWFQFQ